MRALLSKQEQPSLYRSTGNYFSHVLRSNLPTPEKHPKVHFALFLKTRISFHFNTSFWPPKIFNSIFCQSAESWIQDFGLPKSWIQDFGSPKSWMQDFWQSKILNSGFLAVQKPWMQDFGWLDYQPLFGKGARAPPPNSGEGRPDRREQR